MNIICRSKFAHFEKDLLTFKIIIFRAEKECEVQGNFVSVLFIHKRLYSTQFNVLIFPRTVLDFKYLPVHYCLSHFWFVIVHIFLILCCYFTILTITVLFSLEFF